MGTKTKTAAAILVAAICVSFLVRAPWRDSRRTAAVEPSAGDLESVHGADPTAPQAMTAPAADVTAAEAGRRSPGADVPSEGDAATRSKTVLRVVVEDVTERDARRATVTVIGRGVSFGRRDTIQESWSIHGLTSEYDLDPFLARVTQRLDVLRDDELVVELDHPGFFRKRIQVPLSGGVKEESGQTAYEVRVPLLAPTFWPAFSLAVRDAKTREHLEDVELRCVTTALMGVGMHPGPKGNYTLLGDSLSSPIAMRGGHEQDDTEQRVAGMALPSVSGKEQKLFTLGHSGRPKVDRGLIVFARAPGYAWTKIVVDLSTGGDRELLLGPEATLGLRLANVQSDRYAELEMHPLLTIGRPGPNGDPDLIWHQGLDGLLETEGLLLEGLIPGDLFVRVELSPGWRRKPTVLARAELALATGEDRELLVTLADPPEPKALADLGGVVSFPNFGAEEDVRLEFYRSDYRYGDPDHVLPLAELEHVAAALPTWSFHLENVPVDRYQIRLRPLLKSWMIELPAGGRDDVELVIPELAEVLVETVDARTGERVPVEKIAYRTLEVLPDQVTHGGSHAWADSKFEADPGRFRFWAPPGVIHVKTASIPDGLDYGGFAQDLELVPGLQSVRLELTPACTIRFEFRVDGAPLPYEDGIFVGLSRCFRAVGHDGRVGGMYPYSLLQASAPGLYEIDFEGVGSDRFLPIPSRRIEVREGETTEVIVKLRRQ